jgi:hypothetical protein
VPCCECCILYSEWFPGVRIFCADISENSFCLNNPWRCNKQCVPDIKNTDKSYSVTVVTDLLTWSQLMSTNPPPKVPKITLVASKKIKSIHAEKQEAYMSCVNFWVVLRRMVFNNRRFGTLCLFHLHRQVDAKIRINLPMKMEQSVPKRRLLNTIRRRTTQKVTHDIQNTAKAWKQEVYTINLSNMKHLITWCPDMHHADRPLQCVPWAHISHVINT